MYKQPQKQLILNLFSSSAGILELITQPIQSFVQTISISCTGCLNVPVPVPHVVEAQLVSDLSRVHGLGQVLLVGKDQHHGVPQLILRQHPVQLVPGLGYPLPVIAVHHEYQSISVLKVMSPERSDLVLTAHIPDGEADVLVLDRLHIEPDGGDGRHNLPASTCRGSLSYQQHPNQPLGSSCPSYQTVA